MLSLIAKLLFFAFISLPFLSGSAQYAPGLSDAGAISIALSALALSLLFKLLLPRLKAPLRYVLTLLLAALFWLIPSAAAYLPLFLIDLFPPLFYHLSSAAGPGDEETEEPAAPWAVLLLVFPLMRHFSPELCMNAAFAALLGTMSEEVVRKRSRMHSLRDELAEKLLAMQQRLREERSEDERNRHIARLDERNRISRKLHDVTGHTLSSALLQVGALSVINQDERLKEPLEKLHETLDWGMTEIRNAVHDLHADSCDLALELQGCLDRAEGFETKLNMSGPLELPLQFKLDLLAIAREAVTNAVRHSEGSRIELSLVVRPSLVVLDIADDGRGLPAEGPESSDLRAPGGMGLDNMREVAERNGGILALRRSERGGLTVHAAFAKDGAAPAAQDKTGVQPKI